MNSKISRLLGYAGIFSILYIGWVGCSDAGKSNRLPRPTVIDKVSQQVDRDMGKRQALATLSSKPGASVTRDHFVDSISSAKDRWAQWVRRHPFANRGDSFIRRVDSIPKRDRPDLAAEHYFLRTVDPALGIVPKERLFVADEQAKQISMNAAIAGINWTERGPANVGGRTRAMAFDPNDGTNKKFWAGGVGGGLWYTNDITAISPAWNHVDDLWDNIAISSIAFDPSNTQNIYVGTGEGWSNSDAQRGGGIWKSANGGTSWSRLASTDPSTSSYFRFVNKLAVTSAGVILAATNGGFVDRGGIMRSADGGATWTNVLRTYSTTGVWDVGSDIEIDANGDIFASFGYVHSDGKVFKSTNGGVNWTDISSNVGMGSARRVEIACAPSDASVVYAVASMSTSTNNDVAWMKKSTDGGATWTSITIPKRVDDGTTHFTRSQAWYDLILQVHPTNSDVVLAGGIDLHRSTDGGTNWTGISHWYGGFSKPYVHADHHAIVFRPGNPSEVVVGSDGGVDYSTNAGNTSIVPTFRSRNYHYNVTQFYSVSGVNEVASHQFLAGAQDNGTQSFSLPTSHPTREVTGGDGAFAHIDQVNPDIRISSYTFNSYYRSLDGGTHFTSFGGVADGHFINPTAYDSQRKILYSAAANDVLRRFSNMSAVISSADISLSLGASRISAIKVSPYNNVIFLGTEGGRVYKVTSPDGATPVATRIDLGTTPISTSGYISCIDVGVNDDQLLVTFSNYGVNSIWETSNGGTHWYSKEGNLPDIPVNWALYNPSNRDKVLLATELGVWTTDNFGPTTTSAPVWGESNTSLARTRCDMLYYRTADKLVAVATHGRGLFTTDAFATTSVADFTVDNRAVCSGSVTVQFTDGSINHGNSWAWDIDNDGDTDYTTQNPTHTYTSPGLYNVKLTINHGAASTIKRGAFVVMSSEPTASAVCSITDNNTGNTVGVGIYRVTLSNLDHTTEHNDGPYQNYACGQYALLNLGTTYSTSIYTGTSNDETARMYIDYNDNGAFEAGEIAATFNTGMGKQTVNFTTPSSGVVLRKGLRLRFVSRAGTTPPSTPCNQGTYSQIEDYTVFFEPEYTWTGATSTAWNVAGNWSPAAVPSGGDHVVIPNVANDPVLAVNTTVGNLTLGTGALLTLNGYALTVTGNLSGTGVLKGSAASSLNINGPSGILYFDQTTTGTTNLLKTLTLAGSAVTTLGNDLQIAAGASPGAVTVTGSTQLVTGGFLTLRSDANGTARIDEITSTATTPISGNVTVERYVPAGRKWRLLTAPLKGSANTNIFYNWQNNDVVTGSTGAEIWGSIGTSNPGTGNNGLANGLGYSVRKFASNTWTNVTNTNTEPLFGSQTNNGLALFVTGPYQNGNGNIASGQAATTLRATGNLITGDHTKSLTASVANEYFLVGNPYASPVRPASIELSAGMAGNFWMWDASDINFGRYVAFDRTSNQYSLAGGSGFSNTGPTAIQSGQAFFVKATTAGPSSLIFRESFKNSSVSGGMFGAQSSIALEKIRIHLQRRIGDEYPDADAAWAVYHPEASKEMDRFDGSKLANSSENLSLVRNDRQMTFEYLPPLKRRDTLFLRLSELKLQEYRIEMEGVQIEDTSITAELVDRISGQRRRLDLKGIADHVFIADSMATNRFMIVMSKPAPPAESIQLQATVVGRTVRLDWTVRDGYEMSSHVLERMTSDGSYRVISAFGPASEGISNHSVVDADASTGINKYRVTAIGQRGLKTLSNPATADLSDDLRGISVFPNPVKSNLRVSVSASHATDARLTVVDAKGSVVHRQRRLTNEGTALIDASRWSAGVYRVILTDASGVIATETFIKE
ncbi:MAG: GEVED domain-containing protein [Chitinophagaceae bacterium]|jgi:PKD repeat protein|nr:GEVED domain-containing protein [Chitinophagaceae bacterium]